MPNLVPLQSKIDSSFHIWIMEPDDERYDNFKPLFDKFGHAFTFPGKKMMFIDGKLLDEDWITPDHLHAIVAHEICHYLFKHNAGLNKKAEMEADIGGIEILKHKGLLNAANILTKRFIEHYGKKPNIEMLPAKYKGVIEKYLK